MYNNHIDSNFDKNESTSSRWNRIIILDQNKNPIPDQIYQLDSKARLLTKLKRQKRRDLGKVTGKKKVPKNWKQIIENLDQSSISSVQILNDPLSLSSDPPSSSFLEQETQPYESLPFDKLVSIDWLLNQPTDLLQVYNS